MDTRSLSSSSISTSSISSISSIGPLQSSTVPTLTPSIDYNALLRSFPPIVYAFGYGSGIFPQLGYRTNPSPFPSSISSSSFPPPSKNETTTAAPMLDFIFVVENPMEWHKENIVRNKHHYSYLWQLCGYRLISYIQEYTGAGIWYNTLVPIPNEAKSIVQGQLMKYGIISLETFLEDCLQWKYFYLAGRLHKPVNILLSSSSPLPSSLCGIATRENLRHALRTALLILPSKFTAYDLYLTIASLSYTGDWRMVFGENPHKVMNIVNPQLARFHALYGPILQTSFPMVTTVGEEEDEDKDKKKNNTLEKNDSEFEPKINKDNDAVNLSILGITLPTLDVTSPLLDDKDLNHRIKTQLYLVQDTSPEARLVLGLSLPLSIQKHMAQVYFHEQKINTSTIIQRIRQYNSKQQRKHFSSSAVTSSSSPLTGSSTMDTSSPFTSLRQQINTSSSDSFTVSSLTTYPSKFHTNSLYSLPLSSTSSASSSSSSLAVTYAERGKHILQRLRYQRFNRLVTRKDKWKTRFQNIQDVKDRFLVSSKLASSDGGRDNVTRNASSTETFLNLRKIPKNEEYLVKLLHESSGISTTAYARARNDPLIVSFWDAMVNEMKHSTLLTNQNTWMTNPSSSTFFASSSSSSSSSIGDIGIPTARYLRPSIAHTVSITARTQSIKGIVTAGPYKSLIYVRAKLEKYFKAVMK